MAILATTSTFILDNPLAVVLGLPLCITLVLATQFFMSMGKNPFSKDTRRRKEPLELDQTKRDAMLRQGFLPKRVPENLDAIVIGSGIGGLTAANILSRAGKKVLVLEQHDRVGGACHTFIEKGYEFDVGIHYICDVTNDGPMKTLCDQMSEGQLAWQDMEQEYDVVSLGTGESRKMYPHHTGGPQAWRNNLVKMFPKEEQAIDRYMGLLEMMEDTVIGSVLLKVLPVPLAKLLMKSKVSKAVNLFLSLAGRTTQEVVEEFEMSAELRAVICSSWGDYGVTPERSSAFMQLCVNRGYMHTSCYPIGGASEMVIHLIPTIERAGGRVLVRAPVSQILTDQGGRAIGVRVHRSSGDVDIHAPIVISNAGVTNTFRYLLPEPIARTSPIYKLVTQDKLRPSIACIQLFVGLKGTAEQHGLKAQNIWAYSSPEYSRDLKEYLALGAEEASTAQPPVAFISMNGAKDPTFLTRFPGKTTIVLIGVCNPAWFKEWEKERVMKRGAEYDSLKTQFGRSLWNVALSMYPHLDEHVDYFEAGTSLSNDYYLGTRHGEMYGLEHDLARFGDPEVVMSLRPNTGIPGLYLSGQDVYTDGYVGAMVGGVLTTVEILRRNVFGDIENLEKKLNKNK